MFNLLRFELRVRTGAIIGWGIGLFIFAGGYLMFYPSIEEQFSKLDISNIPLYQAFGEMNMATFEGYMASTVVNFLAVIFAIYAVVNGTGTLAGEEDAGTLELLAAMPLPRWQIVTAKAVAIIISGVLILVLTVLGVMGAVAWLVEQVETQITAADSIPAVFGALPITMCFMMISLFLGAWLPNRRAASTAGTVIVIFSYLGSNLANMIDALKPVKPYLPFTYYETTARVFTEGIDVGDALILLGVAAVFLALAILAFQRRNLTTGAWFWQRGRG